MRDALRTSFHEAGHITVSHVLGVQADRAILGNFGGGSTQYAADAAMDYETTGICALAGIAVEEALFPSEMRLMGHAVLDACKDDQGQYEIGREMARELTRYCNDMAAAEEAAQGFWLSKQHGLATDAKPSFGQEMEVLQRFHDKARQLVDQNFQTIEKVAKALAASNYLGKDDISRLLQDGAASVQPAAETAHER